MFADRDRVGLRRCAFDPGAVIEFALEGRAALVRGEGEFGGGGGGRLRWFLVIEVCGGMLSSAGGGGGTATVQVKAAGVVSTLPAASVARTEKVWEPTPRSE